MKIWNLGYSKVGLGNQWFPAVQNFEKGELSSEALLQVGKNTLLERWRSQHELGVDSIPLNDFSVWDSLLDTAWLFNLLPTKVESTSDWVTNQWLFVRGSLEKNQRPLNRISWFRTAYRCFQPEWDGKKALTLNRSKLDWEMSCQKGLPYTFHATLLGPWTLASHTRIQGKTKAELLKELIPLYLELLKEFKRRGFEWVQLEEPSFCCDLEKDDVKTIGTVYDSFKGALPKILIATYYESPDPWLTELSQLPVQGLNYDCVSGPAVLSWIKTRSFPKDKQLGLGLVSGMNIWASSVANIYKQIEILKGFHPAAKIHLSPSCPLIHLPLTKVSEKKLKAKTDLYDSISFSNERLEELHFLKQIILGSKSLADAEKQESDRRQKALAIHKRSDSVRNQINRVDLTFKKRTSSFAKRSKTQAKRLNLPKLPITVALDRNSVVGVIKDREVDVLPTDSLLSGERLYEYAKRWNGLEVTEEGWIHQEGSSCVRPPIVVSDLEWKSLPKEGAPKAAWQPGIPVIKGVVLGPITLVNRSYCRLDLSKEIITLQAALAVRQEIKSLESTGLPIVQVDEPAFCEQIPLKKQKISVYLKHQVDNLKISTSGVKDETGIHLNIDSADLFLVGDCLEKSDVDVLVLSATNPLNEKIQFLKGAHLECAVCPSLATLSSENNTSESELDLNIRKCCEVISPDKLWVSVTIPESKIPEEKVLEMFHRLKTATDRIRRLLSGKN